MGASKSKSARVAADEENDDTGPTNSRKRNLMNKGNGRLESKPSSNKDDAVPRDGLSSAPSTGSGANSPAVKRTHSAPRWSRPEEKSGDRASARSPTKSRKAAAGIGKEPKEGKVVPPQSRLDRLGEYVIEGPYTAEQVDEYLTNVLGSACTKNLRSAAWAQRVQVYTCYGYTHCGYILATAVLTVAICLLCAGARAPQLAAAQPQDVCTTAAPSVQGVRHRARSGPAGQGCARLPACIAATHRRLLR